MQLGNGNRVLILQTGSEYIDQVTLTPGLVIPKQSIGVSSNVSTSSAHQTALIYIRAFSLLDLMVSMASLVMCSIMNRRTHLTHFYV